MGSSGIDIESSKTTQAVDRCVSPDKSEPGRHLAGLPLPNQRSCTKISGVVLSVLLLFLNYFLAQYDKFILSYFQEEVMRTLKLSSSEYGILSGYATGIVYALLAIPVAFIADYTEARVWVLSVASLWWSVCVVFQGLSHNFWQILLARIGMGIGQSPVEALSVSLISDMMGTTWLFFGESVLYVGVYIGEAVSGQIATAFSRTHTPWNSALKAIGIAGIILAVIIRLLIREPPRRSSVVECTTADTEEEGHVSRKQSRIALAKSHLTISFRYVLRLESFWLLTLSAAARQFSGNIFGFYMPSFLSSTYPSVANLLSRYGIIVGVVGSVAVICGGLISSYASKWTFTMPLYITAIGGMISSVFVILMVLSRHIAGGSEEGGTHILYGVMSAAYLTAELWLGAFASLLALLLPPRMKTFGLAIYMSVIILVYSSGPQIVGLALRDTDPQSDLYMERTEVILAVLIPAGYWIAGVGFLMCVGKVRRDIQGGVTAGRLTFSRKIAFGAFVSILGALVVALFVTSLVFR